MLGSEDLFCSQASSLHAGPYHAGPAPNSQWAESELICTYVLSEFLAFSLGVPGFKHRARKKLSVPGKSSILPSGHRGEGGQLVAPGPGDAETCTLSPLSGALAGSCFLHSSRLCPGVVSHAGLILLPTEYQEE